jgi:ubiquinone/menaquinone biosynthesis C-methylase UbiE
MEFSRASAIAHHGLAMAGPYTAATVDEIYEVLRLPPDSRILDVGCGKGEMLLRGLRAFGGTALGLDLDVSDALRWVATEHLDARVELVEGDANEVTLPADGFHLSLCVGSAHVYGGYEQTLDRLVRATTPDGQIVIGDGFWESEPSEGVLTALGAAPDEIGRLQDLLDSGLRRGLQPLGLWVSDQQSWDRYEFSWVRNLMMHVSDHPDDPDAAELERLALDHLSSYLDGYRGVLGFAIIAFRLP